MTRYVIIGAGAVGVTLAVELQRAGREVVLAARGSAVERLTSGAVSLITPSGTTTVDVAVVGAPAELTLRRDDVLVLATKTQDADEALATWAYVPVEGGSSAGEVLPLLTLQNGLHVERSALRRFATVIGSVLWIPSTYVTDTEVVSPAAPAPGIFWLGDHPDGTPSAAARTAADDLAAAGFEVQLVDDLSRWKAAKLLSSATFVLDALYVPGAERDRAAELVRTETRRVLVAAGYDPADLQRESTVRTDRFAVQSIPGHERPGSSTYQSLARGRSVETDYLNGEVVLLARERGLRAPISAALVARVHRAVREGTQPGSLGADDLAATLASATVLVDVATLTAELDGVTPPALLDVRWTLGDPDGEKHYLDGHLPGAVYVDLDTELASPPSTAAGRHPLPAVADLQAAAQRWGLRAGQPVVVYDNTGGMSASRAWWLLRWAGAVDVRILDGGLAAWNAAGGTIDTGSYRPERGDVEFDGGHLPVLTADEAAVLPASGVLLDARAGERYRGEVEPIDSRAGHVPGALSLPTGDNLDADGHFRNAAALRERFADARDAESVGVYCGSGVTAAHQIAALQIAGIDAALYPGSWSAWSGDPDRPVATGSTPS